MSRISLLSVMIVAVVLSGCSRLGETASRPLLTSAPTQASQPATQTIKQSVASAEASTSLGQFIDGATLAKLSSKDQAEATSAQFYALQYGRPGAPRSWQGDSGATGKISVGPYVRVNNLDCREFSHVITIAGQNFAKSGTACREIDGRWNVA